MKFLSYYDKLGERKIRFIEESANHASMVSGHKEEIRDFDCIGNFELFKGGIGVYNTHYKNPNKSGDIVRDAQMASDIKEHLMTNEPCVLFNLIIRKKNETQRD